MKKIYLGAVFIGLLGPSVVDAQALSGNVDSPFLLKGAEALGEAESQTAMQKQLGEVRLPEVDSTPFELRGSESVGGVSLETGQPLAVPRQDAVLPTTAESGADAAPTGGSGANTEPPPAEALPPAKESAVQATGKRPALPAPAVAERDAADTVRFGIAPIQWGGDISESLRWRRYTTADNLPAVSTLANMQMFNLRASSYLWQPWIATVDGGIGLLHSTQTASGSSTTGNTITGSGGLSVFPRSRFPFRASYDVSDSRTSTALISASGDYSSKRLGLQQGYRTVSGESNFSASYDRSLLSSTSFGDDIVSSLKGAYSAKFGDRQTAGLNLFHTESSQQRGASGLTLNGFTALHNYRSESSQLTVDTNASLTDSVWDTQNAGAAITNSTRFLQAGTFANWRPSEDKPLYVNGGLRLFNGRTEYAGAANDSLSVGANVMASYSPTRNIALSASGSVTSLKSGGVSSITTTQAGNAAYNADVIKFGKLLSYNWHLNGSVTNQTNSAGSNDQRLTAGASHSLFYPYVLSGGSALNFTVNQGLTNMYDRLYGSSNTLTHNGSMSWNAPQTESLSGAANLTVGDTHTFGYGEANYQFANMQLNGRKQFTMNSSLGANAGWSWNRQGLTGQVTTGANGSMTYLHSRAFNVRGLRYSLTASVNTTSYNERLLGNVDAQRTQSGYSLEQHLNYRIGKLDTSLSAILSRIDGKENASIYMRIARIFGNM